MNKYLILIAMVIIFFSCKKENAGTIANDHPALSKLCLAYHHKCND
jgi:hypothetical protein